jgi:myo-inositol-1(or 4)-monophosphatase
VTGITHDTAALLAIAVDAARRAGDGLRVAQRARVAGETLTVDTKSTLTDPVSEADRASERTIVKIILDARPDDGIVGEEDQADRPGTTGLRWVIDPLDGTVNFLQRIPQWCVSIGVEDADGPLVGVVHHPDLDETFTAIRGGGAWLGSQRLQVTDPARLREALLTSGFAYDQALRPGQLDAFARWGRQVRYVRRLGAAAIDLAWIAAGRGDAYAEAGLHPWDWSAGTLLVTEAGGRVTHVDVDYGGVVRSTIVAAGPGTHDRVRELLRT